MTDRNLEDDLYGAPGAAQAAPQAQGGTQPPQQPQEPAQAPEEPVQEPAKAKEFDARHRERLTGLLFLGRLEDEFEWLGHKFVIRTRTAGEQIEAGLITQPTVGTRMEMKAWQCATVAAGVMSVDGAAIVTPLRADLDVPLRERYNEVLRWYQPVVDQVYERVLALEIEARELVDAMGEAYGQGTQTPG